MITIGGLDNINATNYCDWEYMSVAIYDLTDGTKNAWGSVFAADKPPYQVNAQVYAVIGGGLDGNATKMLPTGGWSTTLIATLFTGLANQTQPVNIHDSRTSPLLPEKSNKTNVIIGSTIGGIAALALLAAVAFICVRHYFPNVFAKNDGDEQECTLERAPSNKSQVFSERRDPGELPPGIHDLCLEAAGTPRCELEHKLPAELAVEEIHGKGA
jgi:hypothetical protein